MEIFGDSKPVIDEENYEDIKKAIAIFYPNLLGSTIEFIGRGTYARAYKVDNLVFKLTRDYDDALASLRVMGKNLQHIVKVHNVFKIHSRRFLIVSDYVRRDIWRVEKYAELAPIINEVMDEIKKHIYYNEPKHLVNIEKFDLPLNVEREIEIFFQELIDNDFTNADAHDENVRVDEDGNFKLIDLGHMTSSSVNKDEIKLEILT